MTKTFTEEAQAMLMGCIESEERLFEFTVFPDASDIHGGSVRLIEWDIDPETGTRALNDAEELPLLMALGGGPKPSLALRLRWDAENPARRLALLDGWIGSIKPRLDAAEARDEGLDMFDLLRKLMRTDRARPEPVLSLLSRKRLNTPVDFCTAILAKK